MSVVRACGPMWKQAAGLVLACAAVAAVAQTTVQVTGYQVTGNSLIEPGKVDAVLLPMLGQRSQQDLQRAAAAVQALYQAEGYGAVVALSLIHISEPTRPC